MTTEGIDPAMHTLSETPHNVPARRPEDDALDLLIRRYPNEQAAIATVREALERLREDKIALAREGEQQLLRAESAEAEVRRLTEGLRVISDHDPVQEWPFGVRMMLISVARALLSAGPSDGGGAK